MHENVKVREINFFFSSYYNFIVYNIPYFNLKYFGVSTITWKGKAGEGE